ncbi:hypothetical protein PIB30_070348 [Stylosanthes scabra]|uniref:Aminotransferase-like plant mobile domain-containing protein n=1 Tax=Stylosanthes scabra TaxID=79078 RepID=A0ABU6XPT1_9FABA|nr:hypothetical protein [Stylosanthes scabra]
MHVTAFSEEWPWLRYDYLLQTAKWPYKNFFHFVRSERCISGDAMEHPNMLYEDPRTLTAHGVIPYTPLPDCLVPYIREAGFGGPLQMRPFDYDMLLVSALVERWRPETQSFHLPWGHGLSSRTPHERRPDQRVCAGFSELVRDRDLGNGPGISGRSSPGRRGKELRWGEAELAEASREEIIRFRLCPATTPAGQPKNMLTGGRLPVVVGSCPRIACCKIPEERSFRMMCPQLPLRRGIR